MASAHLRSKKSSESRDLCTALTAFRSSEGVCRCLGHNDVEGYVVGQLFLKSASRLY
jgi:hypothetical protein